MTGPKTGGRSFTTALTCDTYRDNLGKRCVAATTGPSVSKEVINSHTPLDTRRVLSESVNKTAKVLGRGPVKSETKITATRAKGKLGGRPRKYSACKYYENKSHRFSPYTHECYACGYKKDQK
jgi:hypothetical protein